MGGRRCDLDMEDHCLFPVFFEQSLLVSFDQEPTFLSTIDDEGSLTA